MKKATYFVIALAMLLLLSACSQDKAPSSSSEPPPPENTSSVQPLPVEEPADAVILSVTLSGTVDGEPVEKTFVSEADIAQMSELILDKDLLEVEVEGLEEPDEEAVITARVQDGPGTSFVMKLIPATVASTGEEILVIRGEISTFCTDIEAYHTLRGLIAGQ